MELLAYSQRALDLIEVFDKLGASNGTGLRSPHGPGSPPSQELVQAFEALLEDGSNVPPPDGLQPAFSERGAAVAPDMMGPDVYSGATSPTALPHIEELEGMGLNASIQQATATPHTTALTDPPPVAPPVTDADGNAKKVDKAPPEENLQNSWTHLQPGSSDDTLQEVAVLVDKISTGELAPADLYRLQYLTGMLNVQASTGNQISQQTADGLESILRQQG